MSISTLTKAPTIVLPEGSWVVDASVSASLYPHDDDNRIPRNERPLVKLTRGWSEVYAPQNAGIERYLINSNVRTADGHYRTVSQTWRLISSGPFVVVRYSDNNIWAGEFAPYQRGIQVARQIHHGHPGMKPELSAKPDIRESTIVDPKNASRNLNWVNLTELVQITGLDGADIVRFYAGFSASTVYEPNVAFLFEAVSASMQLRIYPRNVPTDFCLGETKWGGKNALSLAEMEDLLTETPSNFWVTQSFAYEVIRLAQFNYRPDKATHQPSLRLEAPQLEMPAAPMPVLTDQQFRDAKDLRMDLEHELSEVSFRSAAQRVLGVTEPDSWQSTPVMDDPLGGMGQYYNRFHSLTGFDSRLVISTGFWTRAGASKSRNYYAGCLAVFPEAVDDPRRDPSAILRLWFWPGEVVRMTPDGSLGGLCPSSLPPGIAESVYRFLLELGYNI